MGALQLGDQCGSDAPILSTQLAFVFFCFFVLFYADSPPTLSSHGCHQEEDADAQARQGECLGQS